MSSDANMRSYSFKKLAGFRMTDADKQWYNENPGRLAFFHDTEVWTDAIPATPPVADTTVVKVYDTLTLTEDLSVSDHRGWAAISGTQLTGFIPPRFGSSYFVAVYDNNDDEIVSSDASVWTFDYDNGFLWFEGDPTAEGWTTPIKIRIYHYIGTVLDDASFGSTSLTLQQVTTSGSYTNHGIQVDASGSYMYNLGITSGSLEMFNHNIIHLATPTADYDAATKKYVDDNSGASTDTLDDVVERGSFTDHGIQIDASGSMFYNLGITSGSIDMFSNQKIIHLAIPTADGDAANKLYVDTVSGSIGDDLNNQISNTREYVDTVSGSIGVDIAANYAFKDSVIDDHGNLAGLDGDDHTQYSLVDGTRDYTGTLQISGSLSVDGSIRSNSNTAFYNFNGGEGDVYWYVYEGGSSTGASLKWSDASVKFEFSEDLTVRGYTSMTGNCIVGGNLNINNEGPEGDSQVSFYEAGANAGAYLKWDDAPGTFVLSHTLSMSSTKITSVVDPTDDQDAATKKYVDTVSGSIGDDLNNQISNTREYVDTVSGSIGYNLELNYAAKTYVDDVSGSCAQSLQGVTSVGDVTTNVITATGFISTGDNSTVDVAYTPMVLYNTDATPPAASGFPIGTVYIQYTA